MQRIFQYSTLLLILMRSGILFLGIRFIEDITLRYKAFEIFQLGIPILPPGDTYFEAFSYQIKIIFFHPVINHLKHRSFPILSLIISFIWTGFFLKLDQVLNKPDFPINETKVQFWKKVFYLDIVFSFSYLIIGLLFDYLEYNGFINDFIKAILNAFNYLLYKPVIFVNLFNIGNSSTNYLIEYLDNELISLIQPSFALIFWAILITYIQYYLKKRKTKVIRSNEPDEFIQPKIKWRKIEKSTI